MDLYQPLLRHVLLPLWALYEGTPYLKYMKYLQQSQYFSEAKIRQIQLAKVQSILRHAYTSCAYYRKKYDEAGVHPDDVRTLEDFRKVPLLTKAEFREHHADIIAPHVDKYRTFLTSGSTGKPLRGYCDKECSEWKRACGQRSSSWGGYRLGERIYNLYGNPEKEMRGLRKIKALLRRKYLGRTEVLDLLSLTDDSMMAFARKMMRKPPAIVYGHGHALYQFALFAEKKSIEGIRPRGIFNAGMILYPREREKIESVFNCKVFDRYGTEELGLIAAECDEHKGLHINTDAHYVEFVGGDGLPVGAGEEGLVIVTDLTNRVNPFVRYKLEDVAVPAAGPCTCGRGQPLILRIEGRVADFLLTPERQMVSGISLTDHFAGHVPGVEQMQIIQEEIDSLTLRVATHKSFGEAGLMKIDGLVKEFFGCKMRYRLEYVREIPKEASGKYRFTICKVNHGGLS